MYGIIDFVNAVEAFRIAKANRGDDLDSAEEKDYQEALKELRMSFKGAVREAFNL